MPLTGAERSARRRARARGEDPGPTQREAALAERLRLGVRRCGRCREIKPLAEFARGSDADGARSWCKACCAADTARRKAAARQAVARAAEAERRRRAKSVATAIWKITPGERAPDFAEARCRRYGDPSWWQPQASDEQREAARNICGGCPIRAACLAWVMSCPPMHGIWGGTDERERRDLLRSAA